MKREVSKSQLTQKGSKAEKIHHAELENRPFYFTSYILSEQFEVTKYYWW